MEMKEINNEDVCAILNSIMEYELAGVVRYTHSSLMVTGPYRLPIVNFLKEQASESLLHSQQAGELIVGLDGHPSQKIAKIEETNRHTIKDILEEALEHELHALSLYKKLLASVADASIYLEEYARGLNWRRRAALLRIEGYVKRLWIYLTRTLSMASCRSPASCISETISQPPINSPFKKTCGKVGQSEMLGRVCLTS